MEATVVDLRYKMKDVLKALDRRERVRILYHGKLKGTIVPAGRDDGKEITKHPFFGMRRDNDKLVEDIMQELRGERYRAV